MPMLPQWLMPQMPQSFPLFPQTPADLGIRSDAYKWMQSPMLQHPGTGYAPRGLLDQYLDVTPMLSNRGMLAPQSVADIIKLYGKGGLNPYTEMRDPGAGGGRGLLGSQWRDPAAVETYAARQGYRPGTLQPVPPRPATVRQIPSSQKYKVAEKRVAPEMRDPTREEMESALKKQYGNELDEFDKQGAIHWFASRFHGGQNTNMYEALDSSQFKPGATMTGPEKGSMEMEAYRFLRDYFGGK